MNKNIIILKKKSRMGKFPVIVKYISPNIAWPLWSHLTNYTVINNRYRFWVDLLHKWSFLGYDLHP